MKNLLQKVAYLKGLTDGLNINKDSDEGKVLIEIINTLDNFADAIADIDYRQSLIVEDLDEIDDDLADLEDYVYDNDLDFYDYSNFNNLDFEDFDEDTLEDFDFFDEELITDDEDNDNIED